MGSLRHYFATQSDLLVFTARALVDPQLRAIRDEAHDRLRDGCRDLVRRLLPGHTDHDIQRETDRLHALVDGLAVHAATRPDHGTPHRMRTVITLHLDELQHATRS
ncbi:TetR family transcriptional regulator C-terminal domain-containing protein [Actinomadura roseirufa]|uniref:TetR family transcriptional regulator C-terminal domain-containing protein n=1 Tax=Actinomadura roseirufa TaxID=2094049 RepID=UPI0013F16EE8|nr:TetR family transcriptional regulator C-terminal domain-containing protein [Actinomadura roseirufa]